MQRIVFVAQLVEQLTLNQWAVGSSPTEDTLTNKNPCDNIIPHGFFLIITEPRVQKHCFNLYPKSARQISETLEANRTSI